MACQYALFGERITNELVVALAEEALGWPDRIRRIGDDDIELILVVGKVLETVFMHHCDALVVKRGRHVGQEASTHIDDHLLERRMLYLR